MPSELEASLSIPSSLSQLQPASAEGSGEAGVLFTARACPRRNALAGRGGGNSGAPRERVDEAEERDEMEEEGEGGEERVRRRRSPRRLRRRRVDLCAGSSMETRSVPREVTAAVREEESWRRRSELGSLLLKVVGGEEDMADLAWSEGASGRCAGRGPWRLLARERGDCRGD